VIAPFRPTQCAICGTSNNATETYPASLTPEALSAQIFSARRAPDGIHYRIVRCKTCGLLRSDPVVSATLLEQLYSESAFNYEREVHSLIRTYGRYLSELDDFGVKKDALLEIGCGNGFFLREAARQGYRRTVGVEPSKEAVAKAKGEIEIVCDIMRPTLFAESSFDAVCLFQVLDHLPDPTAVLRECRAILRPGGLVLCLNHDVGALSARLLGRRSPIIDIEHTYLFDRKSIRRIFAAAGYDVLRVSRALNLYSLRYLVGLLPVPHRARSLMLAALSFADVGALRCRVPLGNLYVIARRPIAQTS
jgi:SAM-dependent methyltransferase